MDFQTAVKTCLSKYVTFSGRAARSEYWWFSLFLIVVTIVLSGVDYLVFGMGEIFSPLSDLFSLATFLPAIAVTARRLHDIDRSGWWMLIGIVPIVGWILMIYWLVIQGTDGPNRFGHDPLGTPPYGDDDGDYTQSSIPNVGS
ncbi:DUF805 domain-containing protein [Aliiroseovarius lamellibrachiae]|uniref:DUF805 domain-containing protein n=1 Tax=Aliiroseovarius lamellibrachiae TaxID=1924933 RepID=UPI001BE11D73|nr:DUF805 domain-containing protein [Aliiroseovarius lamellibrachiae]MBT2130313.1 DUF805 domain-containing protein [Aliiroseovarius lamellibrachiae]